MSLLLLGMLGQGGVADSSIELCRCIAGGIRVFFLLVIWDTLGVDVACLTIGTECVLVLEVSFH